jgi:hypothetical protein
MISQLHVILSRAFQGPDGYAKLGGITGVKQVTVEKEALEFALTVETENDEAVQTIIEKIKERDDIESISITGVECSCTCYCHVHYMGTEATKCMRIMKPKSKICDYCARLCPHPETITEEAFPA